MEFTERLRKNWQSAIVAIAGIWFIASPFVFEDTGIGVTLNGVLIGIILVGYGLYDFREKQIWGQRVARYWAMAGIGAWMAATPWLFGTPNPFRTSNLVTGVIVAVLAIHQLYRKSEQSISPSELGSDFRNN